MVDVSGMTALLLCSAPSVQQKDWSRSVYGIGLDVKAKSQHSFGHCGQWSFCLSVRAKYLKYLRCAKMSAIIIYKTVTSQSFMGEGCPPEPPWLYEPKSSKRKGYSAGIEPTVIGTWRHKNILKGTVNTKEAVHVQWWTGPLRYYWELLRCCNSYTLPG